MARYVGTRCINYMGQITLREEFLISFFPNSRFMNELAVI